MAECFSYPVIMKKRRGGSYFIDVIDFQSATEGGDLQDAFYMAKDCICNLIASYRKHRIPLPTASTKPNRILGKSESFIVLDINYDKWKAEAKPLEPLEIEMSHV